MKSNSLAECFLFRGDVGVSVFETFFFPLRNNDAEVLYRPSCSLDVAGETLLSAGREEMRSDLCWHSCGSQSDPLSSCWPHHLLEVKKWSSGVGLEEAPTSLHVILAVRYLSSLPGE